MLEGLLGIAQALLEQAGQPAAQGQEHRPFFQFVQGADIHRGQDLVAVGIRGQPLQAQADVFVGGILTEGPSQGGESQLLLSQFGLVEAAHLQQRVLALGGVFAGVAQDLQGADQMPPVLDRLQVSHQHPRHGLLGLPGIEHLHQGRNGLPVARLALQDGRVPCHRLVGRGQVQPHDVGQAELQGDHLRVGGLLDLLQEDLLQFLPALLLLQQAIQQLQDGHIPGIL